MQTTIEETAITQKTKELCQAILAQPEIRDALRRIDAFLSNSQARAQYDGVMSKGQALHEKQHQNQPLSQQEIAAFESERDALLNNPVARGFLDAQEQLQAVHKTVTKYVSKTLELGAMPTDADLEEQGCCGGGHDHGGCGCGHSH